MQVGMASRYQVGHSAWEAVLNDMYTAAAAAGKKVLMFADLFLSVGDAAAGFYQHLLGRGGATATPLPFFLA